MMHQFHTNTTATITLTQLQTQLESGPIFIGEDHANPFAREAIKELINSSRVNRLFLELPNLETDTSMQDIASYLSSASRTKEEDMEEMIITIGNDMERMTGRNNSFSMGNLIQVALAKGETSIYFHDSPIVFRGNKQYSIIDGEEQEQGYAGSIEGVQARNIDSARIITRHGFGPGTIILAGHDHLDPQLLGPENTLQHLLRCGNDSIFNLSTAPVDIK